MIDKREMQYLYDTDDAMVFMDNETYEQIEIPTVRLEWERKFVKPNDNVKRNQLRRRNHRCFSSGQSNSPRLLNVNQL